MYVTDKLTKPLTEVKYLNADNVDRYRCIMRIFFDNYEKLKYWMYQEEVYDELKQDPYFADYKMEQCQQDLNALTAWKNLRIRIRGKSHRWRSSVTAGSGIRCQNTVWRLRDWFSDWKICLLREHHWNRRCWNGSGSMWGDFLRWYPSH